MPDGLPCAQAVTDRLTAWEARGPGLEQTPMLGEEARIAFPTATRGVWVLLRVGTGVALARVDRRATHEITFSGAACGGAEHARPTGIFERANNPITDEDLGRLLEVERRVALVVWSPHSPESVAAARHLEAAAHAIGVRFVAVVEPQADARLAYETALAAGLPADSGRPAHSIDLHFRGALRQPPTVLTFIDGEVFGLARTGKIEPRDYEAWLLTQFGER